MQPQQTVDRPSYLPLPIDILVMIIEALAPEDPRPILPASDPITKTLLALTRVSKATYPTASKLLWQNCLYIDSKQRAQDFLRFLSNELYYPHVVPSKARGAARLYLSPFPQEVDPQDSDGDSEPDVPNVSIEEAELQATEPQEPSLHEPNLSISINSPEEDANWEDIPDSETSSGDFSIDSEDPPSPLDDLPTAQTTHGILVALAPVLKTLIIDMPLRSLYPPQDRQSIRPILRRGFEAVVNLEEFVSVRDELFLATRRKRPSPEPPVWAAHWPKLRRLSLYNQDVEEKIWRAMAQLRDLEVAVFPRPDPLSDELPEWNMKEHWLNALPANQQESREFFMILVDCPGLHPDLRGFSASWRQIDPQNRFQVRNFTIQPPLSEAYDEGMSTWPLSPGDLCQIWIKKKALDGTLWDAVQKRHEVWLKMSDTLGET
ncbi:hypothetical protein ACHAPT_010662 [Fusarium lateritium]